MRDDLCHREVSGSVRSSPVGRAAQPPATAQAARRTGQIPAGLWQPRVVDGTFTVQRDSVAVDAGREAAVHARPVNVKQSRGTHIAQLANSADRALPQHRSYNQKRTVVIIIINQSLWRSASSVIHRCLSHAMRSGNVKRMNGSVNEPNMFHNYETEKITCKAGDVAENLQL